MMLRHAQSHRCVSHRVCILLQEVCHNHRKCSSHPSLTNRHRSSSQLLLITESHVTPLCATHIHFPSTSELIQRHSRERYRCTNTEIMTTRIWNDRAPIRIVETTTKWSFQITFNPHHFSFQITHITSPLQREPKLNHWQFHAPFCNQLSNKHTHNYFGTLVDNSLG